MTGIFTEEDDRLIEQEATGLRVASKKRCATREEYELVLKAFDFANDAHRNVRRRSGDPYILHPIAVAKIVVSEIGLGCKSICAALLHDVVEDTDFTVDDIRRNFGDKIASLVDGLTKIKTALDGNKDTTSLQAENFKRILLTLNDDVRIVLIKLADRLHNVRTIEFMPEYKRDKILSETMYIFAPLAHRLGLYAIKTEMENIWLRFREPEACADIQARLNFIVKERENELEDFIAPIKQALDEGGYTDYEILKRLKSPYSIWKKMNAKNIPFEEIYDLYAIRIIFKPKAEFTEREQCWHIFTKITTLYPYKADRTRDWTKEPKSNGYEALHLTAMSNSGNWIEVQIRTERMNSIDERGLAAHWLYKNSADGNSEVDSEIDLWLKKVREIIENPDANAIQFLDNFHKELITSDIYVFTPKGEAKSLEKGSTVLDFAYGIHSDIGNHAIAGKVNQKLVALSQVLHNGDQVEIISSGTGSPKREWLDFLKTQKAKNIVLDSLRKNTQDSIGDGLKILDKKLEERGISDRIRVMKKLLNYYQFDTKDEFYSKIGLGVVTLDDIDKALRSNSPTRDVLMWGIKLFRTDKSPEKIDHKKEYMLEENPDEGTTSFVIAECCAPIPGDSAMGLIDENGNVVIHKKSCSVANDIASKHGDKVLAVRWSQHFLMSFLAKISLSGIDRVGFLSELTKIISGNLGFNIRKISIEAHDGVFEGTIELYVHSTDDLEKIIRKINQIKGIESVNRVDINQ